MSDDFQQRGGSPWGSPPGGGGSGNGSGRGPRPPDVDKIIKEFQEKIRIQNEKIKDMQAKAAAEQQRRLFAAAAASLSFLDILALFAEETHFGIPSPGLSLAHESPVTTFTQPFLPSFDLDLPNQSRRPSSLIDAPFSLRSIP